MWAGGVVEVGVMMIILVAIIILIGLGTMLHTMVEMKLKNGERHPRDKD